MQGIGNIQLIKLETLELILFNTYIQFNGSIFKQILGIPMGGNASPFIADLNLSWCEYFYMTKVVKTDYTLAKLLSYNCRYLDHICTINIQNFGDIAKDSEPHEATAVPGPEHQLPHQPTQPRPAPRPILVKFASRRTKARVMGCKKDLKSNPCTRLDGTRSPVTVSDDLTKRRATLAFQARTLKRAGTVADAWTFDSKVYIKDNHNRIHPIAKEEDLRKFQRI